MYYVSWSFRALLLAHASLLLGCLSAAEAVRVRSTIHEVSLEVKREEICMYSHAAEHNEGALIHIKVIHGGKDFDVYVRDPHNKTVYVSYAGEHRSEDRVYFTKRALGEYSYCVDNRPYSGETKIVNFAIGVKSLKRWKDRIDPLMRLMQRSDGYIMGLHDDQMVLRMREGSLREKVNESRKLVLLRGLAETVVVVFVSVLQVVLIKQMFSNKGTRSSA
ncbi:putative emp24 gp25L p24 family GOLD [Trypanosoma vivax]|uniref:GOLD domain-containing protein n=1 Tax=Trypanosoma vivax (strain Y486) TaxID=1055687 RepID=G0TYG9_TRYVY|nr:hypothetical protein TRVL_03440 [Trypanosoma vivax]KAH8611579.1 putative emp24 gp25L p24 family GOLD [Trypanosoma vivax]CCC49016.1 conserved hypothetical protein [Trypanosoma vivax Y486]